MTQVAVFPTYAVPQKGPIASAFFDVTPDIFGAMQNYMQSDLCRLLLETGLSEGEICRMTGLARPDLKAVLERKHRHTAAGPMDEDDDPAGAKEDAAINDCKRTTWLKALRLLDYLSSLPEGLAGAETGREMGWSVQTCRTVLGMLSSGGLIERSLGTTATNGAIWLMTDRGREALAASRKVAA